MKLIKCFSTIVFLFTTIYNINAQNACGFDMLHTQMMSDSAYRKKMQLLEENIAEYSLQKASMRTTAASTVNTVYSFPVVFHIMHHAGTPLGTAENLSDYYVQQLLQEVNNQFRKVSGSNGDGNGVDTGIEFCLASIDPNGYSTTGIEHINASVVPGYDRYGMFRDTTYHYADNDAQVKGLSDWDHSKYINIWIVTAIDSGKGGIIGFAGVGLGVVAVYNQGSQNISHELGHEFSLLHTFQGGCGETNCSTQGDLVCDTPPTTVDATVNGYTCTPITPYPCGVLPLIGNYMDYTSLSCRNMFTQGQTIRMEASLLSAKATMYQTANLTATGCNQNVPPEADFIFSSAKSSNICVGDTVVFQDLSTRNPTSWNWTFQNGIPATSSLQNPQIVFATGGLLQVSLTVSNSNGSNALSTYNTSVTINASVSPTATGASGTSGSKLTLNATGAGTLNWYNAQGIQVGTGQQYTTPALTATTTYYVQDVEQGTRMHTGMNPLSDPLYLDSLGYLQFSVDKELILDSVTIFSYNNTAQIGLRDKNNKLLQKAVLTNLPLLKLTAVPLNFHIEPDTGYTLTIESPYTKLGISDVTANSQFPYILPGYLNIYWTDFTTSYYPFFYNWVVREFICPSEKIPVIATIPQSAGTVGSLSEKACWVYPNPVSSFVNVVFNNESEGTLELIDASGKLIQKAVYSGKSTLLNVEQLSEGIYILNVMNQDGSYHFKLIKTL